jgi:hypothetical protein
MRFLALNHQIQLVLLALPMEHSLVALVVLSAIDNRKIGKGGPVAGRRRSGKVHGCHRDCEQPSRMCIWWVVAIEKGLDAPNLATPTGYPCQCWIRPRYSMTTAGSPLLRHCGGIVTRAYTLPILF